MFWMLTLTPPATAQSPRSETEGQVKILIYVCLRPTKVKEGVAH